MPPLPFPTFTEPVAEAVIKFASTTGANYDAVNVLHFVANGLLDPISSADLDALGDSLNRWVAGATPYTDGYNDCFSAEYTVFDVVVTSEQTDNELQVVRSFGASGNLAGDLLPREVAAVASLRTGMVGRSRRGRTYVPGQTESVNTDGKMLNTHAAVIEDRFGQLILELPGDTGTPAWALCIASHTNGFVTVVNDVLVDLEWDTQRRRGL